jgi:DNA-binding transcriptional MocR family regulator
LKVLYVIPTGSNPSGGTLTLERKEQLYNIAKAPQNDLLILEDDPYYYLQLEG